MRKLGSLALAAALTVTATLPVALPVRAQNSQSAAQATDTQADAKAYADMRAFEQQAGLDKRAYLEQLLNLTPAQGAKFWPIYDTYQSNLHALNKRMLDNITAYARAWNAGGIDDATADKLATAAIKNREDEVKLLKDTYKKARHVMPALKAAQFLQFEAKLRAIIQFEQAAQVPLAH